MTMRHILTDTDWADERTVIDPRSLDPVKQRAAEQRALESGKTMLLGRFTRPPGPHLPSFSLPPKGAALGFVGLAVALTLVSIFAVREHRAANALREALQTAEMNRLETESRESDSTRVDPPGKASVEPLQAALLAVGDRARAERKAIDSVVANNYTAALGQFELLLNAFPEDYVYSDLIVALRWRLRCGHQGLAGGHRCN